MIRISRNNQGVIERWITFIFSFFAYVVLFLLILDGMFFVLMQASIDMTARQISYKAATLEITRDEAGEDAETLAEARCQKAHDYFQTKGSFIGYTEEVREQFLQELASGAKPEEELDRSTERKGIGNGCYFKYDEDDKLLRMIVIVEGKKLDGSGVWPVFTRGLLKWFGKEPKVLYGRASYIAEAPGAGAYGHYPLDNKIKRSLNAYGVTIDTFVPANDEDQAQSDLTKFFDSAHMVVGGGLETKEEGGTPVGFKQLTLDSFDDVKLPLIISSIIYQWKAESTYCGVLEPDEWDNTNGQGFTWKLSPSEFMDIGQGDATLLPCYSGECDKAENIESNTGASAPEGRYSFSGQIEHYLPPGAKKQDINDQDFFFARATNLDGNNGPLLMRKDSTTPGEEDTVRFTCAFSSFEVEGRDQRGQDGQAAIIKTVIDHTNSNHGEQPVNPPTRNCPLSNVNAQGDVGPYEDLNCAKPTESWSQIEQLHTSAPRYQNPLDRILPYYKYVDTCSQGSPHCGYFGTSDIQALMNGGKEWFYKFQDEQIPTVGFEIKTRLMTSSTYTRQNDRARLACTYQRNVIHQHCCNGNTETWCRDNTTPDTVQRLCMCTHTLLGTTMGIDNYTVNPRPRNEPDEFLEDNVIDRDGIRQHTCCIALKDELTPIIELCSEILPNIGYSCTTIIDIPDKIPLTSVGDAACNDDDNTQRTQEICQPVQ